MVGWGADEEREGLPLSLAIGSNRLVQISSFAPLAPLSPSHRVGNPAGSENGHDHAQDESVARAGAAISVSQAVGPALPPASLLPPVNGPALAGGSGTSTDAAAAEVTQSLPGAPSSESPEKEGGLGVEEELTGEEKKQVDELKSRDREVRQHEQAHMAAAGSYANGGPSYEYTQGPDGKRYATGGEVSIDTSKEGEPEATIRKAQQIYRAALAPAEPSSQDRSVASKAKQMESEARAEMSKQKQEETAGTQEGDPTESAAGTAAEGNGAVGEAPTAGSGRVALPGAGAAADESDKAGGMSASIGAASAGDTAANLLNLLA